MSTHVVFKSLAQLCETFVFVYIGITAGLSISSQSELLWSLPLILYTLVYSSRFIYRHVYNVKEHGNIL